MIGICMRINKHLKFLKKLSDKWWSQLPSTSGSWRYFYLNLTYRNPLAYKRMFFSHASTSLVNIVHASKKKACAYTLLSSNLSPYFDQTFVSKFSKTSRHKFKVNILFDRVILALSESFFTLNICRVVFENFNLENLLQYLTVRREIRWKHSKQSDILITNLKSLVMFFAKMSI